MAKNQKKNKKKTFDLPIWAIPVGIVAALLIFMVVMALVNSKPKEDPKASSDASASTEEVPPTEPFEPSDDGLYAKISVKDYGDIWVKLEPEAAPITVANFVKLAKSGFYDGLTFHRIMEGFMIQGGDPKGNGTGGSEEEIKGEFSANGVENPISHKRGVISMARHRDDMDSASSQFFIVQRDSAARSFDGQYAAFGCVVSGIEYVDKIAADAKPTDDNGTIARAEQPVITSVTIFGETEQ